MKEILVVKDLKKTFHLSRKQQKLERTSSSLKVALNGLSFAANEGEIYGLLGPNGAGKTTTMRILATLIKADSGEASIDGIDVRKNPEGIRKEIGFLTSDLKLEDFFTPTYLFNFFSDLHGVEPSLRDQRRKKLFGRFGIDRFAEVKVGDLSTGMKQKVSIAISIAHDPKFIIFDEPTNGLDVITAKSVTDFLIELKGEGKTIILSTHILSLVEKICDRIGIIFNGKMAVSGTLEEVTGGRPLDDIFFELYQKEGGEF
jgi:sodium transport system ATP-binding protein